MAKHPWNSRAFPGSYINYGGSKNSGIAPKEDPIKKATEDVCRHLTLRPDSVRGVFKAIENHYKGSIYHVYDDDGPRDASYLTVMISGKGAKRVMIYSGFHGEARWEKRF